MHTVKNILVFSELCSYYGEVFIISISIIKGKGKLFSYATGCFMNMTAIDNHTSTSHQYIMLLQMLNQTLDTILTALRPSNLL